ncbi:MAG: 3-deoxy-manno-octulosonate cytidylyltransferase [Phycisphaeraceae bacterium]
MSVVAVIPARYASTRLPGKPLLDRTGRPLVVHVADAAARATLIDRVLIATDDERIAKAAADYGYESVMTRADHPNGTSRIAEVAQALPAEVDRIVNVQGDEPMIDPALIDALVARLSDSEAPMATVASPFAADEDPADRNIVKVVLDQRGRAMYFSRSLIPHDRDGTGTAQPLKHIGLYGYRRSFLPSYLALEPTPAEQAEQLEQLRALEHGFAIAVITERVEHHGIDTPEQYEAFVAHWQQAEPMAGDGRS